MNNRWASKSSEQHKDTDYMMQAAFKIKDQ